MQDPVGYQPGDKVRIRTGSHRGCRGILRGEDMGVLRIELNDGSIALVSASEVTNYSLAARRAWEVMPKQAGRPHLSAPRKKMVSMRLDIEVWKRLGQAAEFGLISSREQAVNTWLIEKLDQLLGDESHEEVDNEQQESAERRK